MSQVRVTLTLDKRTADRLRAECHARGMTASDMVKAWVDRLGPIPPKSDGEPFWYDLLRKVVGG